MKQILAKSVCMVLSVQLALSIFGPVIAQNPKQPQVPKTNFQAKVTVKEVGAGMFKAETDDGEQWIVKVEAQPKDIIYNAAADANFLRPGQFVRLAGKVNRRGQTAEKVSDVTVFTPKPDTRLGLIAEETRSSDPDLFVDPRAEKRSKPKPSVLADPTYDISGRLTKVTRTELTIDAAGTVVRAQLADKLGVSLVLADLSYLRAGDKVEFGGWYITGTKGQAWATKITATAAEPLTDAGKKGKAGGK
jgi:hypothetical protein